MSFEYNRRVIEQSKTRGPDRAILLVLAFRANDEGKCWPALQRIAREAGVSLRTVTRGLVRIQKLGELVKESRGREKQNERGLQATNRYKITISPKIGMVTKTTPGAGSPGPKVVVTQASCLESDGPGSMDPLTPESSVNQKESTKNQQKGREHYEHGIRRL